MTQQVHPFSQYVRILGRGKKGSRSLSFDEARDAMSMIVRNEVEPMQLGAFLMLLRVKEESPEELAGFVSAIRTYIQPTASLPPVDLDWSSYAGKRQHHPWYLLAALALADQGYRVFMHGTSGHTEGRLYSEQALASMGVSAAGSWQQAEHQLATENFTFMPIAAFCPPLEQMLQLKPILGLRSVANSLARLLNPTAANATLSSVFHPRYGQTQLLTLEMLGQQNAAIFKGEAGEAERKPDASCELLLLAKGIASTQSLPRLQAGRADKIDSPCAITTRDLWRGASNDQYGHQAVLGTLAVCALLLGEADNPETAQERAHVLWESRNRSRL